LFKTPKDATPQNKFYILPQLPYPSGAGLHVGHAEVYSACDIHARYQRMKGKKVLQVIGWDSFGLPAENYAIKTNVHPRISTNKAIDNFREQIKSLGISVDWDREVGSHNSDFYKWTQWFFLLMYKRGLAYRKKQAVNWCKSCKTVLANEQVTADGKCERCDTVVVQRDMEQWYLKITDYAEKLLEGIDDLDWPEETKKRQKDWIGKSEGASVNFKIVDSEIQVEVFTTRPDTLFGATFMVLAPEGQYIKDLKDKIENWDEVEKYIEETSKKTELDRQIQKEKTGVELKGIKAINPANGEEIPVFIADYVLATYGTGAIMAVPAHDERDFEFATRYNLQIRGVLLPGMESQNTTGKHAKDIDIMDKLKTTVKMELPFVGDGMHINSQFLDGLNKYDAVTKIIEWLEENNFGKRKIQYKLRDWSVSRQRFWGAPIPMLQNEKGGIKPVSEDDLPIILPDDVDFKPTGESPLNYSKSFNEGVEKKYGKGWKREPDTLDTFMCSSWYYYRYLDPKNNKEFASKEALKKWMPADFYLGGPEHVNGHLLYARFFTKVLHDAGYVDFDEPFKKHRHQGLILGSDNRKMSKRWANSINPTDVVKEYGADTTRMYEMFMGPLEDDKPWNMNGVKGAKRFLDKVWNLFDKLDPKSKPELLLGLMHKTIKKVSEDMEEMKYNTAIAQLMIWVNELLKHDNVSQEEIKNLVLLLSPFAPHLSEELWKELGNKNSISPENWPEYNSDFIKDDVTTLAVQINGKLRHTFDVPVDESEEKIKDMALGFEQVQKWLEGKEPKKVIYVKGKLISIVV